MRETRIQMCELDECIICHEPIKIGTDPAVCCDDCLELYEYECNFNKMAKKEATKKNK